MNLPNTLEGMDLYFDRVLRLLEKWNWIYEDRATDILLSDALNSEYLDALEEMDNHSLNQLPLGITKECWPPELVHFVQECALLSLIIPNGTSDVRQLEIPDKLKKSTSLKKAHEINNLASYVLKHCADYDITRVYDVGSGLGYIDRVLTLFGRLSVVGIESDNAKITTATKINKELLESGISSDISYIESRLDYKTLDSVGVQLGHYEDKGCLIGLHACGDLSAVTLRLYLNINRITSIILMSCCYHKMKDNLSFPISKTLERKLTGDKIKLINTTFLRLASGSTKERWSVQTEEEHTAHAFSVLARAVIQSFLTKYKLKATRNGRRCVTKQHKSLWAEYVAIWLKRHEITDEDNVKVNKEDLNNNLNYYWTKYSHLIKRIEVYSGLQMSLQGVAESLLIADRLSFLLESGQMSDVTAVRITKPSISPRSVAIIATKHV